MASQLQDQQKYNACISLVIQVALGNVLSGSSGFDLPNKISGFH